MTQDTTPDLRTQREWAEHRRLAAQTTPDRDGADSARLYALDRKQPEISLNHGLALAGIAPSTLKPATFAHGPSACETEGHEYDFGICLDCGHYDPAFEPTDDMIERDYLRGYDRQAAA